MPDNSLAQNQSAFDQRLVDIDIILPEKTYTFSGLSIYAAGSKFGSALQNTCECRIYNLTQELQNTILSLVTPQLAKNYTPITLNLRVGRESYGTFLLFSGNVIAANVTQPPDVGITLRSLANNYWQQVMQGIQQPAVTLLSEICSQVASNMGLFLDFEASDKQIDNYSFTGSLNYNIKKINALGNIHAFEDNGTLVVLNIGATKRNTNFQINAATGMVGVPQVTTEGVEVRTMVNNAIYLGGEVTILSTINPAANGNYKVMKIDYEIASRDQPFWYNLHCNNLNLYAGPIS